MKTDVDFLKFLFEQGFVIYPQDEETLNNLYNLYYASKEMGFSFEELVWTTKQHPKIGQDSAMELCLDD